MESTEHYLTCLRLHNMKRPGSLRKPAAPRGDATTAEYRAHVEALEAYDRAIVQHKLICEQWEAEHAALIDQIRNVHVMHWSGSRFTIEAVAYVYDKALEERSGLRNAIEHFEEMMEDHIIFFDKNR